jgi:hypothetical protein
MMRSQEAMMEESKKLASASFGILLLHTIGRVYVSQAEIQLGNFWSSAIGRVSSTYTHVQSKMKVAHSALKVSPRP